MPSTTAGRTPSLAAGARIEPPAQADIEAEIDVGDRIAGLLTDGASTDPLLAVLSGPVGCGLTAILRRAVLTAGRSAVWLHVLPGRVGGNQGCLAQWTREDGSGEQATAAGLTLSDVLEQLGGELSEGAALIMDGFHTLTAASANTLIVWTQAARLQGIHVLIGFHPALDHAGLEPLLNVPAGTTWIDVRPLREDRVRDDLAAAVPWVAPGLVDIAVDACAGSPLLLRGLRRALSLEEVVDAAALARAHATALESGTVRTLVDQGPDALTLGLLGALVRPTADLPTAADALGLPPATAARYERLLAECGMVPVTKEAAGVVHAVLARAAPIDVRRVAAGQAHTLLAATAGQGQLFRLRATVGDQLTGLLPLAEGAYAEAWADGDPNTAAAVATTLLARTTDPNEITWAKAGALRCWAGTDWGSFTAHLDWFAEDAVREQLTDLSLCDWLSIEAPATAPYTLSHDGSEELQRATRLAIRAVYGHPAEADVRVLDDAISSEGILGVSAPLASRLALAWLALADYEAAHRWASVAAFTASENELSDCAVGHLLAAQALIRLGHFDQAEQQAEAAVELFAAFGATNLEAFARLSGSHAAIEAGRPVTELAEIVGTPHPGLSIYRTYVSARLDLQAGRGDSAVRQLFDCGRALKKAGVINPSLLNWRPHLASIFTAKGQPDFTRHVEDDLVAAWRDWAVSEPDAAARRISVLGVRAGEVVAEEDQSVRTPTLDMLSPAELRVVDLVVQGMSNRDAAKHLFLSKRTVDTHLGNVYRKLSLGSREDLVELMKLLAPQRGKCALTVFG